MKCSQCKTEKNVKRYVFNICLCNECKLKSEKSNEESNKEAKAKIEKLKQDKK